MNEEKKDLLKTFQSLDKNGDGHLTKEELLEGSLILLFIIFIDFLREKNIYVLMCSI